MGLHIVDGYRALGGESGIFVPPVAVGHDEGQYDPAGHQRLFGMQAKHFWYRGRHRFLMYGVKRWALPRFGAESKPSVIDLGGGCGGWVKYLGDRNPWPGCELALSDSSVDALEMARPLLPAGTGLYQTDLMNLQWENRWDIAFLLDVLEHLPEPEAALREIWKALRPGGLLFVTVPALMAFWSIVDETGKHQKRYHVNDFAPLARETGFKVLDSRYFMFLLSPLVYLTRKTAKVDTTNTEAVHEYLESHHDVPNVVVNTMLSGIFGAETPLGHYVGFPWGTSLLCVMEKI